jgi:hypothetical protein
MLRVGNFKTEKVYKGKRLGTDPTDNVIVTVEDRIKEWMSPHYYKSKDENSRALYHHVYHSPTGFNWGYGGSGPADLARSILWDLLEEEPDPGLYHDFKFEFVARWQVCVEWEIEETVIRNWITSRNFQLHVNGPNKGR